MREGVTIFHEICIITEHVNQCKTHLQTGKTKSFDHVRKLHNHVGFWNIQLKNTLPLIISNELKLRVYNIFYKKYQMYQSIVCKKSKNKKT